MTPTPHEIHLEQTPTGTWQACIIGLPDLVAVGTTSNEAIASLDRQFDTWYRAESKAAQQVREDLGEVWTKVFYGLRAHYQSVPAAAPGDFYVESDCCTSCGVPQVVAPDLVGWTEEPFVSCYWKKQPETQADLEQAFKIFEGQELGCHRYAGLDPIIQKHVGYDQCDRTPDGSPRRSSDLLIATWGKPRDPEPTLPQSLWMRLTHKIRGN